MRIKIITALVVVMLAASTGMARTPGRDDGMARFKREMMPKVGKKITVTGTLRSAKLGLLVEFKGMGIYIYATKNSDSPKMSALNAFVDQPVKATGRLRYNPGSHSDQAVAALIPEHFYFDVAGVKVSSDQAPRSKSSNNNRVK